MRMSKKLLLIIVLVVAAAGLAYLIFGLVYVPGPAQFQVTGVLELGRTEFRRGETITVEPFLTYTGMRRQVTIYAGTPLLFVEVYTAENERTLELPVLNGVAISQVLWSHTLRPNVPFNEKDRWPRGILTVPGHRYNYNIWDYVGAYSFRLEQAGSYKVVVRAEFMVGEDVRTRLTVYSEPIWVQITG